MAEAVADHAEATDPQDVVAAEQRMRAQARHVAAGLHTEEARRSERRPASDQGTHRGSYVDPAPEPAYGDPRLDDDSDRTPGARTEGHGDPATDPRYDDPHYGGRPAADPVDPRHDDRGR